MQIDVEGEPKRISKDICIDALNFYLKKLIPAKNMRRMFITLSFENFSKNDTSYGSCEYINPLQFIICLDRRLYYKPMLLGLAHEAVHVAQFRTGKLKYQKINPFQNIWLGVSYDLNKMDYWDYPWEIDAYGREKGLYHRFTIENNKNNHIDLKKTS